MFPIPMRGNEERKLRSDFVCLFVPDPHEG